MKNVFNQFLQSAYVFTENFQDRFKNAWSNECSIFYSTHYPYNSILIKSREALILKANIWFSIFIFFCCLFYNQISTIRVFCADSQNKLSARDDLLLLFVSLRVWWKEFASAARAITQNKSHNWRYFWSFGGEKKIDLYSLF